MINKVFYIKVCKKEKIYSLNLPNTPMSCLLIHIRSFVQDVLENPQTLGSLLDLYDQKTFRCLFIFRTILLQHFKWRIFSPLFLILQLYDFTLKSLEC
jgi:hypothetical protein